MENKQAILDAFREALVLTRSCENLQSLTYDKDREKVIAEFKEGHKKEINVAWDSGIAMISDIVKNLR